MSKTETQSEREMLEAAARAAGFDEKWVEFGVLYPEYCMDLVAALRISVEHNHAEETRPWVCASIDGGPLRMRKAFVEDVPDESRRWDRMRLAILRCAAAQAPKEVA